MKPITGRLTEKNGKWYAVIFSCIFLHFSCTFWKEQKCKSGEKTPKIARNNKKVGLNR